MIWDDPETVAALNRRFKVVHVTTPIIFLDTSEALDLNIS